VRPGDVRRQHVGRHLDSSVIEAAGPREKLCERRFRDARNTFEQDVSPRQYRDRQVLDQRLFADKYSTDFFVQSSVNLVRSSHQPITRPVGP